MVFSLKKKPDATISAEDIAREATPLTEFIPYYCHYNPDTVLTKNGELLQIIKVSSNTQGLNYESGDSQTVREIIRKAVMECVKTDHFSFWIHTIRKRRPISFEGNYSNKFAAYVHDQWRKKHRWKYQYYNEVYLTIIREGQSSEMFNPVHFKHVFLPQMNRDFRNRYLDAMHKDLDNVVTNMLHIIRTHYNAHRLGVTERIPSDLLPNLHQPIFYSEPAEFLGTLLNLTAEPRPLLQLDLSNAINDHTVTFGYNALETKSAAGVRRFGALLTLKQYHEAPAETIDRILQASTEMIVSQSFVFIPHKQALKALKAQKELFDISGDAYSSRVTGLDDTLRNNNQKPIDFGEQQISITVIVDEYKNLEHDVIATQNMFGQLGMTTVREDIMLEECFWAQLPGNFEFIRRKDIISTAKIAGFSRLNRFPTGKDTGNHWKEAVTTIPTSVSAPYFFNFHHQDNGHTLLIDFNSFHDQAAQIIENFLLTTSLKYDGRLFIFDYKQSARLLFDKIDGEYYSLDQKKPLFINPFSLEYNPRNVAFLLAWCSMLIEPSQPLSAQQKETLRGAIEQIFAGTPSDRTMAGLAHVLATQDAAIAGALTGTLASITPRCIQASDKLNLSARAVAFNMDPLLKNPQGASAVFAYLLHRIISDMDGRPTIIVLNEMFDLLENDFFAPRLESLLEMLKQNNIMMFFSTNAPQDYVGTNTMRVLLQQCATKLYVPDEVNIDYEEQSVGLSAADAKMLKRMERGSGDFLFKQSSESIGLQINLDDLADTKSILANDIKTLITAGGKFASLPKN